MTKADEAKAWALAHVGCPYIYGATGAICTPAYRQARMTQYPNYAAKIQTNCPRLRGETDSCADCKWCDPDTQQGKTAFDCAQFARRCMEHIGISLVSGANSQWEQTAWEQAGEIGTMPRSKMCLVYRYDDDKKRMGHVGIYLGDGWIVHAKGHDYGVVKELLGIPRFTHWGIPMGLYSEIRPEKVTLRNGYNGDAVTELQKRLKALGYSIEIDGKFGKKTEEAVKDFQKKNGLTVDGIVGPKTWAKLPATKNEDKPSARDAEIEPVPDESNNFCVLSMEDALALKELIGKANAILIRAGLGE